MKFSFESPKKEIVDTKKDEIKNSNQEKDTLRTGLKKLITATGFTLAMMPALAQKIPSVNEKNIQPKEFTNLEEYEKARKKYEDSMRLHIESYNMLRKVSKQIGVKPKIEKNYADPFVVIFGRNNPNLFFSGTEKEEDIKKLLGPGGPTSMTNGNGERIYLKDESVQSLREKLNLAREARKREKAKNKIYSYNNSGALSRTSVVPINGKLQSQKTVKKYNFNQICHSNILPNKIAEFDIGGNYTLWSRDRKIKDMNVIEDERKRTNDDWVFKDEIKKPDKDNMIKYLFGNNNADGSKFYVYFPKEVSEETVSVYLYDKPKQKVVYKPEIKKDTIEIPQKPPEQRALDSVGQNPLPIPKVEINRKQKVNFKDFGAQPLYNANNKFIGQPVLLDNDMVQLIDQDGKLIGKPVKREIVNQYGTTNRGNTVLEKFFFEN